MTTENPDTHSLFTSATRVQIPLGTQALSSDRAQTLTPISPQKRTAPDRYRSERRTLKEAKQRCDRPRSRDYALYGGRGIRVCNRWYGRDGFELFLADVGPKPTPQHTIDRIDVNGNYEPSNVRWATWTEQANNRRSSKLLTWRGQTLTAAEWARKLGVSRQLIANRINRGWSVESALSFLAMALSFAACVAPVDDGPTCVPFDAPPSLFVERAGGTCGPLRDPGIVKDPEAPATVSGRRCSDTGWIADGDACVRGRVCESRLQGELVRVQSEARVVGDVGSLTVDTLGSGGPGCRSTYDFPTKGDE